MTLLRSVLVRTVVLTAVSQAPLVLPLTADDALGAGLLALAAVVVTSAGWAVVDGRRGAFRPAAVRWVVTGVLVGLTSAVLVSVNGWVVSGSWSWAVLASDLGALAPFMAGLVAVPAALGLAIGSALRPSPAAA